MAEKTTTVALTVRLTLHSLPSLDYFPLRS